MGKKSKWVAVGEKKKKGEKAMSFLPYKIG
jgi:hypothetical protein